MTKVFAQDARGVISAKKTNEVIPRVPRIAPYSVTIEFDTFWRCSPDAM
jgi:hypothetical protein